MDQGNAPYKQRSLIRMYIIVGPVFNENSRKEKSKQFCNIFSEIISNEEKLKPKFFRKRSKSSKNNYIFPVIDDVMKWTLKEMVYIEQPVKG